MGRARTPDAAAACPGCGEWSDRIHGYHGRTVNDLPLDGRPVAVHVGARPTPVQCRIRRGVEAGEFDADLDPSWPAHWAFSACGSGHTALSASTRAGRWRTAVHRRHGDATRSGSIPGSTRSCCSALPWR
ncbi:transposase family protein [Nocardia gamkensis]|uniref:transposase family protein n=1 Tax=Nocardia gamkensis TaxID=352869 RepID=UPI0037C56599